MPDIIVVDDEEDLREPTAAYLADQGFTVSEAAGGAAFDAIVAQGGLPRLVVLDVTMPVEDGFAICRRLRVLHGNAIGIVMLTARRDVVDRVVGLEMGADDYVMKPFELRELVARIRAVLRRIDAAPAPMTAAPEPTAASGDDGFWVPTSRGLIHVALGAIDWIEAARDYALLHTEARSHMIRVTMADLEARLDGAAMLRVHRSAFVRPGAVSSLSRIRGALTITLTSGRAVRVGPAYAREVSRRLAGAG